MFEKKRLSKEPELSFFFFFFHLVSVKVDLKSLLGKMSTRHTLKDSKDTRCAAMSPQTRYNRSKMDWISNQFIAYIFLTG